MPIAEPTRRALPLILIRGFGGLGVEDEKRIAYQGFNDGTVYPQKRGENYIYEGLILRYLKSHWRYFDATNVVGYYSSALNQPRDLALLLKNEEEEVREKFLQLEAKGFFSDDRVLVDPSMALSLLKTVEKPHQSLWVFRYYDLNDRKFETYGKALVRLIEFIRELVPTISGAKVKVNIIAHSMGGLIVREVVQKVYPNRGERASEHINKIVTLGTPHYGISFQFIKHWIGDAADDLEHFNPEFQRNPENQTSAVNFKKFFPCDRLLTVVGTNYRTYGPVVASWLNRLASLAGEFGFNYNRSDGLVKQSYAQIPGAPRTFVHKCHGGVDSLVTSREAYEIATRFFHGNARVRLFLEQAHITRGKDFFGKSEFFFGVSIKPRRVDFELFHQSVEAENCYGPFNNDDLSDDLGDTLVIVDKAKKEGFPWAGNGRLIWEGYLDTSRVLADPSITPKDMVLRFDFYVGERDLLGVGFSDNVIFRKQYYVRALLPYQQEKLQLTLHTGEDFENPNASTPMQKRADGWHFEVQGTGFTAALRIEIDEVPEDGPPANYS